jgi:hypothetical protein
MPLSSAFADELRELRDEAEYLIGELRSPAVTDEDAIARTLRSFPALTEDEIRSWWRTAEFRRRVKESREVARHYAEEDAARGARGGVTPYPPGHDPCAIRAGETVADASQRWGEWGWWWR